MDLSLVAPSLVIAQDNLPPLLRLNAGSPRRMRTEGRCRGFDGEMGRLESVNLVASFEIFAPWK